MSFHSSKKWIAFASQIQLWNDRSRRVKSHRGLCLILQSVLHLAEASDSSNRRDIYEIRCFAAPDDNSM
jgi:hypothetical protein